MKLLSVVPFALALFVVGCGQPPPATRAEACALAADPNALLVRHSFCVGVAACPTGLVCVKYAEGDTSACNYPQPNGVPRRVGAPLGGCNTAADCPHLWECRPVPGASNGCFPGPSCLPPIADAGR